MAALLFAAPPMLQAQERRAPASQEEVRLSFAPVVKRAAPAVVNVYVRKKVRQQVSPFFNDPFFREFFGRGFSGPRERLQNSLGSGVFVSADGVIVTNYHVIKGGEEGEIKVALSDNREFGAKVILKDEQTDIAVMRVDAPGVSFPFLEFDDSESLQVGDIVLAIGNPFGVGQTVTSGIVSALARTRVGVSDYQFFIQTDAAINPGNSGGALVDMNGRLVGVNSAIYSRTGASHGIGFAIPSNMVAQVVDSALKGTRVQRPWLGAKLQAVTSDIAESLGLQRRIGALVTQVSPAGPAAKAGLRAGDVIVAVDGKEVDDPRAFHYRFGTKGIGGAAPVDIVRDGKLARAEVALVSAPEIPPRNETVLEGPSPFAGARIANLSPALAEELGMDDDASGVVVVEVVSDSRAASVGFLRKGDIIAALNGAAIKSVDQAVKATAKAAPRWGLGVIRGGRPVNVVIGG
ncbi:MAG: Do family serine endopeptidase [Pseudomonadota bacterium]|nr:Do family serine endopeptidase [Pseudomonadota bacterium]